MSLTRDPNCVSISIASEAERPYDSIRRGIEAVITRRS